MTIDIEPQIFDHPTEERAIAFANQVLVLGGGLELDNDGRPHLLPRSEQRVDRTVKYYMDNTDLFSSRYGVIVCSGGYTGPEIDEDQPKRSEAELMADMLVASGVPHMLIETETESKTSISNLVNVVEKGLIDVDKITPEDRLGVVSHPYHIERFLWLTSRLRISPRLVDKIATPQRDSAAVERFKSRRDSLMLMGADVFDESGIFSLEGTLEKMREREESFLRLKRYGKTVLYNI